MRVLHSSDWHIGQVLYGKKRDSEFHQFFDWLIKTIEEKKINVLLVAGDIFDTTTPSHDALKIYYSFLHRVSQTECRHVVIIGGNHDSPSLLNAPSDLLKYLNVHVIGSPPKDPSDSILDLKDQSDSTELIVCAVPYLRDKDVRESEEIKNLEDRANQFKAGIRKYYADIIVKGEELRGRIGKDVPLIAMGHLFAAGGLSVEGDGVRDLFVGNLAHISADVFPDNLDYVALGHLHRPQLVAKKEHICYSGSPIPMGFGEAKQEKFVSIVEFSGRKKIISKELIPVFQDLERINGSFDVIKSKISELKNSKSRAWIEVSYEGTEVISNLREQIDLLVLNSELEILSVKNNVVIKEILEKIEHNENLTDDLDPEKLFDRLLKQNSIDEDQSRFLWELYHEAWSAVLESDETKE
jgi:exonuclease SbcD